MKIKLEDLGKEVYCVDEKNLAIYREKVWAIGEDFFVPEGYYTYRCEWQTTDFEITYKTLKEAKSVLRKIYLERRALNRIPVMHFVQTLEDEWGYEKEE